MRQLTPIPPCRSYWSKHCGFTLIEALVAILIIAVLSTIGTVVFSQVLSKAHDAKCLNNLKQLHAAALSFASDHNDRLPKGAGSDSDGAWSSWAHPARNNNKKDGGMMDYVEQDFWENGTVFQCPLAKEMTTPALGALNFSYAIHMRLAGTGVGTAAPGVPLSFVPNPQEVILFADACQTPSNNVSNPVFWQPGEFEYGTATGANPDSPLSIAAGDIDDGSAGSLRYRHGNGSIGSVQYITVSGRAVRATKGTVLNRAVLIP